MSERRLPEKFLQKISQNDILAPLSQALLTEPAIAVRINRAKCCTLSDLETDGEVKWCHDGFYLSSRPQFTFDPQFHQGLYYVQDASSMAIVQAIAKALNVIDQESANIRYLDACAAPGGKTTAAIASLPSNSLVVANEYDFKRAEILAENVAKWGAPNVMVSRGDTKSLAKLEGFFHIVAVDAPCSGEGMMRKDDKAIEQWTPALVESCAELQREILSNAWKALKPGGCLIYSTCTFNLEENERNVQWLMEQYEAQPLVIESLDSYSEIVKGIDTDVPCYRFLPGKVRGEGLFIALLQKPQDVSCRYASLSKIPKSAKVDAAVQKWLQGEWIMQQQKDDVYAWPKSLACEMATVASKLNLLQPGLHIATLKGRDTLPSHELALSQALERNAFIEVIVEKEDAIAYLQRQTINLPSETPHGIVLLAYKGHPLGFVKNLGQRANNLYPKNWRIRSQQ